MEDGQEGNWNILENQSENDKKVNLRVKYPPCAEATSQITSSAKGKISFHTMS